MGQYDSVEFYVNKSLHLDSSQTNRLRSLITLGKYWKAQNNDEKTLENFQHAYDLAKILRDKRRMAIALSGIGGVYWNQEPDMKKAIEHFQRAIAVLDSSRHGNLIARNYTRLANAWMVLGDGTKAEMYLTRAKAITDRTENLPVRSYVLASLAILKTETHNFEEVIRYAEEALAIRRKLGQRRQLLNDMLNLSEWYVELKKYDQAKKVLTEAMGIAKELHDIVFLEYYYKAFSVLDTLTGNYSNAYSNLKKSMAYHDTVYSLKKAQAVHEISKKYETEQKEKVIIEKELIIQQQKYQQSLIIGAASILVVVLITIVLWLRQKHALALQMEKQQQVQQRLQTIVHTQEQVQQRIARDLHDGLIQTLGATKLMLQSITIADEKNTILERIKDSSHVIDEACHEARTIAHEILPHSLMRDGLSSALADVADKNPQCAYQCIGAPQRVNPDVEINLFRIAQELITNINRHSYATHSSITLQFFDHHISLVVKDDGKGFDQTGKKTGVGLTNISTRADLIHASVDIQSRFGQGTTVTIEAPI